MAVDPIPPVHELRRGAPEFKDVEEVLANAPSNVGAALESHAESLEEFAEHLREEAVRMVARAHRLRELAAQAKEEGHFGLPVTADLMAHPMSAEKAIRDALKDVVTMEESDLADACHTSKAKLRERAEPLINARKLGRVRAGGRTVYAWVAPDIAENDAPASVPRSSPAPSSLPKGASVVTERGKPVRIRTERKSRRAMSTPGSRQKHKNRDAAYAREQAAIEARKAQQATKVTTKPTKKKLTPGGEARKKENQERAEANKIRSSSYAGAAKSGPAKKK